MLKICQKKKIEFKNFLERFSMECRKNNEPSSHSGQSKHRIILELKAGSKIA